MEKFNGDHGKCMGGAGLLTEAQYKVIADRILEEHRKYGDSLPPGQWAEVAARKVAGQMVEFSVGERVFTESEVRAYGKDLLTAHLSPGEVVDRLEDEPLYRWISRAVKSVNEKHGISDPASNKPPSNETVTNPFQPHPLLT